jgi:hypothetical protein
VALKSTSDTDNDDVLIRGMVRMFAGNEDAGYETGDLQEGYVLMQDVMSRGLRSLRNHCFGVCA